MRGYNQVDREVMKGPVSPDALTVPLGARAKVHCGAIGGDNLTPSVRVSLFTERHHYDDLVRLSGQRSTAHIGDALLSQGLCVYYSLYSWVFIALR